MAHTLNFIRGRICLQLIILAVKALPPGPAKRDLIDLLIDWIDDHTAEG